MKKVLLYLMALLYMLAGINHFINPSGYLEIMPPYLPWHAALVYASGICEIVFGVLLLPVITRRAAAWLIIALLVAVFPANIQMMLNYMHTGQAGLWLAIVRLPLQVVLIWWAFIYTRSTSSRSLRPAHHLSGHGHKH